MTNIVLALMFSAAVAWSAPNPFVGTWKLNPSKSQFGDDPRVSQTTTIEEYGGGLKDALKSTSDIKYEDGRSARTEWVATLDGVPHPLVGDGHYDSIAIKKINESTLEVVSKKGTEETGRISRWVISDGGKLMTRTQKVTTPEGQRVENVIVFEKQ